MLKYSCTILYMRGKFYAQKTRNAVEQLRREGKTYAQIQKIHPIPKSTLSVWLGAKYAGVFDRKAQLEHLKRIRKIASATLNADKAARDAIHAARGADAAQTLPLQDRGFQKSLLAMLYWAEGKKAGGALTFANTDPQLVLLYLTILRNCFSIDENKIRIRLHLHYYHNRKESVQYWSELLRVPIDQFGKLYIKKRSTSRKFRQNFKGICFVVYSNTGLLKEILALGRTIGTLVVSK